ncbi:MAG: L,D-transpeptidase [Proteobacteria bacterium]|nr:L,D-transpeptidase [Pseudomonadota bacterium]
MRPRASGLMIVAIATAIGCGGGKRDAKKRAPVAPGSAADPEPDDADEPAAAKPTFPEGTRSLELIRTVGVRIGPSADDNRIGTVAIDTRIGWTRTRDGKGCGKPWIEITPRGWICGEFVKPSKLMPFGREVPHLDRGELVPGIYGKVTAPNSVTFILETPEDRARKDRRDRKDRDRKKPKSEKPEKTAKSGNAGRTGKDKPGTFGTGDGPVTSPREVDDHDEVAGNPQVVADKNRMIEDKPLVGSINVRDYEEVSVAGKLYWKIAQKDNQYVLASAISPHRPSTYAGARLGDETGWPVPVAYVYPPNSGGLYAAWTTSKASGGSVVRQVPGRSPLPIFEAVRDKADKPIAYRVGEAEWIAASQVRVFEPAPAPALLEPGERWIDVDLDAQILVAFEGDVPVYTTMVSTGGKDTPTETGIYRMWVKESEADMKGLNGEDPYSVATVPWTQFFSPEKGLALHTAYWHDQFGTRRSHGCVNLAPRDARWLYFWSDPQVPPGWTMAAGIVEAPGSIVRVRTRAEPNPEVRGYAKRVLEARQAASH